MLIILLLLIPLMGMFFIIWPLLDYKLLKPVTFYIFICILFLSIIAFVLSNFYFSINQFQFVLEYNNTTSFSICLIEHYLHKCLALSASLLPIYFVILLFRQL